MNCPDDLNYALNTFKAQGHIKDEVFDAAMSAEDSGNDQLTLGYELEVTPDIASKVPYLDGYDMDLIDKPDETFFHHMIVPKCIDRLRVLGFGSTNLDAIYEIKSPYGSHPLSQEATTRGLVSIGLLPETADYEVPAHINFGVNRDIGVGSKDHYRIIRLLRITEMLGGATPFRLVGPLKGKGPDGYYYWHGNGMAGVKVGLNKGMGRETQWQGNSHRIELRSLSYQNSEQFGRTLETAYFLMHSMFSSDPEVLQTYHDFDSWFKRYQKRYGLPNLSKKNFDPTKLSTDDHAKKLEAVMGKYADHLEKGDNSELAERTGSVIYKISDLIGIPGIESFSESDASLVA
jgi:hypothetical protein